tara:strand:- start:5823 stop:6206 length:384 start_codon:yes stop_codon:yes gene_type:complete
MAHRTIEERLEALKLQQERLIRIQAKQALKDHPTIDHLQRRLVEINNNNLKYQRWETEWEDKVANFNQRVSEWVARGEQAQEKMKFARKQKMRIDEFIKDAIDRINNGEEVNIEDYSISKNEEAYED